MSWSSHPAASLVEVCIVVNGQPQINGTGAGRDQPREDRLTHSTETHSTLPGNNLLYTLRHPNIPGRAETSIGDGNAGDPAVSKKKESEIEIGKVRVN